MQFERTKLGMELSSVRQGLRPLLLRVAPGPLLVLHPREFLKLGFTRIDLAGCRDPFTSPNSATRLRARWTLILTIFIALLMLVLS